MSLAIVHGYFFSIHDDTTVCRCVDMPTLRILREGKMVKRECLGNNYTYICNHDNERHREAFSFVLDSGSRNRWL